MVYLIFQFICMYAVFVCVFIWPFTPQKLVWWCCVSCICADACPYLSFSAPTFTSVYWLTTLFHFIPRSVTHSFPFVDSSWVTQVLWLMPLPCFPLSFLPFSFVYHWIYCTLSFSLLQLLTHPLHPNIPSPLHLPLYYHISIVCHYCSVLTEATAGTMKSCFLEEM